MDTMKRVELMRVQSTWTAGILAILFGCAHAQNEPGAVSMKVTDKIIHISMGKNQVKEGDQVAFFTNTCPPGIKHGADAPCSKEKVAVGKVVEVLNDKYSIVKVANGAKIDEEKTIVEKENAAEA
jgi:hypothetical protein